MLVAWSPRSIYLADGDWPVLVWFVLRISCSNRAAHSRAPTWREPPLARDPHRPQRSHAFCASDCKERRERGREIMIWDIGKFTEPASKIERLLTLNRCLSVHSIRAPHIYVFVVYGIYRYDVVVILSSIVMDFYIYAKNLIVLFVDLIV